MSGATKFNVGDVVFAKMKGYPPWPAKIIRVNQKVGKIPVEVYDVYFLGTQQRGTCSKNSIFRYSAEFKRKNAGMEKKQYGKRYLNALRIMEDELFHGKKFEVPAEVKDAIDEKINKKENKSVLVDDEKKESVEENNEVLTRLRSFSKSCSVSEKEKEILTKRLPDIKLRRIDDVHVVLKTEKSINLSENVKETKDSATAKNISCQTITSGLVKRPSTELKIQPKTKELKTKELKTKELQIKELKTKVISNSPPQSVIRIRKTEDLINIESNPLREFALDKTVIGQELYRTAQESPFVIQNVCSVDENFFENNPSVPSFVATEDPLRLCSPEAIERVSPGKKPMAMPPMPPLLRKPSPQNPFGSNVVYLQPAGGPNSNGQQQFLILQPNHPPPLNPLAVKPMPPKRTRLRRIMPVNMNLKNYVAPVRHLDHDYTKKKMKVPNNNKKNKDSEELDEEEEEKIFLKLRKDIFESKEKKKSRDPQKSMYNGPTVDLHIFDSEFNSQEEEPENDAMETELVCEPEQITDDKAEYKCMKCNNIFLRHSFERHKCGTLQFDDINSSNIHNTLKSVITEQNWQNRKIYFTCSVCKKSCSNVEDLADHLNEFHCKKSEIPRDPLALDNDNECEIGNEPKNKEVKLMVCNMLTPIRSPPKKIMKKLAPKPSLAKSKNNKNNKKTLSANALSANATSANPILVSDNTGKQFLLIPQTELNKEKPLDVNKLMETYPLHTIPRASLNKSFVLPKTKNNKSQKEKVVLNGKATQTVPMNKDSSLNSDSSSCTSTASEDDETGCRSSPRISPNKNRKRKSVTIKDFVLT